MTITRESVTREMAFDLVAKYGSIREAANAIVHDCISLRYRSAVVSSKTVEEWIREALGADAPGRGSNVKKIYDRAVPERPNALRDLLDKDNIPLEGARVKRAAVGSYQGQAKDAEGNVVVTTMYRANIDLEPMQEWPMVQPAAPVTIQGYRALPQILDGTERVFIIGDAQIGYWRTEIEGLTPFHDLAAMDCQLRAIRHYRPNRIVIVGDFFDFAEMSKYRQDRAFQETMQPSLDFGYAYLKQVREICPKATIDFISGNHERRIGDYVHDNAKAMYGIRPAGEPPSSWPVYSVARLCHFDELRINVHEEYPAGQVYLTEPGAPMPLLVTHAPPSGRTDWRASIIHGHQVALKCDSRTIYTQEGAMTYESWCIPGTGNYGPKIDKAQIIRSPSNTPSDRARISATQAFGLVYIDRETQQFQVVPVPIRGGRAIISGSVIIGDGANEKVA